MAIAVAERAKGHAWVRESRMAVLLALLVTTVFIIPAVIPYGVTLRLTNQAMLTLVLVSGVLAVADHRRLAIALAAISFGVVAIAWAESLVPTAMFPVLRDIVAVLAFLVLAFAVGINVFAPGHAIGDRVFGAVVLYLLLGLLWAVAYQVVESVVPGSFTQSPEHNAGLSGWFYFSFVTLTTVGYGDIAPVTQEARSLAILEALIGQLYPAVIIARLVSLQASSS
jgi:hypothetical protein